MNYKSEDGFEGLNVISVLLAAVVLTSLLALVVVQLPVQGYVREWVGFAVNVLSSFP